MLKNKCFKALNILKSVSSTDWGADITVLLIRTNFDYGCIDYGSARPSYIKLLDTVHHHGLRLSLLAFRASPVEVLYVEASKPSLVSEYSAIYADGSKDGYRVASEAVFGQQVYSLRLLSASSIFSAKAIAILLALKFVASSDKSKFMICSDSLSYLLAIENCKTQNPFISPKKLVEIYKSLVTIGKCVIFTCIPSHIGIHENTIVD